MKQNLYFSNIIVIYVYANLILYEEQFSYTYRWINRPIIYLINSQFYKGQSRGSLLYIKSLGRNMWRYTRT